MKTLTLLGIASLALNAALIAVIASGALGEKTAPIPAASNPAPAVEKKTTNPTLSPETWQELTSADLAAARDRLQAEGFPASVIRSILAAQIREQFAARRKAIDAKLANQPYWKTSAFDPQTQAEYRALAREEQKALKDLLGPDPINSHAARLRREFPDLAPKKVDQMAGIRERYDEMRQEIYGNLRGTLTPSEREKMNALEKAMSREIATVLTPDEFENYNLRTSNTANNLRYTLSEFQATESEFRSLFRLQSAFDDEHRLVSGQSQEQMRARSQAQEKLNQDIAAALGPQRYADYQRASDYNFRQTSLLVSRLGLPPETATTLYAVQKDTEDRRNAIYRETTPEARGQMPEKLAALARDATARINTILAGNKTATDAYRQYGGSWLTNLVPRPTPTPAPPGSAPAPAKK